MDKSDHDMREYRETKSDNQIPPVLIPDRFAAIGKPVLIGHGANSEVYKLCSPNPYVIKVISPDNSKDNLQSDALHEIAIMQRLRGVSQAVQLIDFDCSEVGCGEARYLYLLEEYVEPYANAFPDGCQDPDSALQLIEQLCVSLIACRDAGVYHLDIQPKNIFRRKGKLVLGDFGSSLFCEELATNKRMRGTLAFMAPEVYREGKCSEQSEIYSVGIILFCLFNRHMIPFIEKEGQNLAIFQRLAGKKIPSVNHPNEKVQSDVDRCVQKACCFDPHSRFSSFEQLLSEIHALRELIRQSQMAAQQVSEENSNCALPQFFDADPIATSVALSPKKFDDDSTATTVLQSVGNAAGGAAAQASYLSPMIYSAEELAAQRRKALADALRTGRPIVESIGAPYPAQESGTELKQLEHEIVATAGKPAGGGIAVPAGKLAGGGIPCPVCGTIVPPSFKYCYSCGAQMHQSAPALDILTVHFSAIAPKHFLKGEYAIINLLMYEEAYRAEVDEIIKGTDSPVVEKKSGMYEVEKGSNIRVRLSSPDLVIEDNEESRTWSGNYIDFNFAVFVPDDFRKHQLLFNAHVYKDDAILTKLTFVAKCFSLREQKLEVLREDVLSAFVSYASQDRNRVASIIQGIKKARPEMDIFFDIENLRSGDDWESVLRKEIENRDILYLCWSHNAKQSKWVDAEWRYALLCKGIDSIEPIPIEQPEICPPPEELKKLHFNDKMLFIINA